MSILKKLDEEIKLWDKCEGAGVIFWMYGWGKKKDKISSIINEDEDDDYRDDTQGHRNAKYLMKARIHADTPKARLKRQRTELRKDLDIQS